jgi:hypothetical protein
VRRFRLPGTLLWTAVSLFIVSSAGADPLDSLERSVRAAGEIADYVAVIHQRQLIAGTLRQEEVIHYEFKRPNSVAIRWTGEQNRGMEAFFCEGHNDDRVTVRLGGALGVFAFSLTPGSKRTLGYSRHPINETSLVYMMNTLAKSITYSRSHPADSLVAVDGGTMTKFGCPLVKIVITTPYRPGGPYYAPRSVLGIDEKLGLPRYYASWGQQGELWEEYQFEELEINVGLPDSDFEPEKH